jgi:hypothetical protein
MMASCFVELQGEWLAKLSGSLGKRSWKLVRKVLTLFFGQGIQDRWKNPVLVVDLSITTITVVLLVREAAFSLSLSLSSLCFCV